MTQSICSSKLCNIKGTVGQSHTRVKETLKKRRVLNESVHNKLKIYKPLKDQ